MSIIGAYLVQSVGPSLVQHQGWSRVPAPWQVLSLGAKVELQFNVVKFSIVDSALVQKLGGIRFNPLAW